jgi:hypothetical protein
MKVRSLKKKRQDMNGHPNVRKTRSEFGHLMGLVETPKKVSIAIWSVSSRRHHWRLPNHLKYNRMAGWWFKP